MAFGVTFGKSAPRTAATGLVLLVLLHAALVWDGASGAPAKRDDVLAGTEFLSVFINGAMAPTPSRRRGSRRGSPTTDHATSESQHREAAIYRISRTSRTTLGRTTTLTKPTPASISVQDNAVRSYPVVRKSPDTSAEPTSISNESRTTRRLDPVVDSAPSGSEMTATRSVVIPNQRVIGVSVTSTVEATPYKVRVEHYVGDEMTTLARSHRRGSTTPTVKVVGSRSPVPETTPISALLVTEELGNLVSESNGSDLSVDEGTPRTSWRNRPRIVDRATVPSWRTTLEVETRRRESIGENDFGGSVESTEPTTSTEPRHHRKSGRHYESGAYPQTPRLFGDHFKGYGEPEKAYSKPSRVYGEPSKIFGEPEKVYSEPAKVYSEPAKMYGEPSKVYSEPAKVYGEPSKIYGEPEKVYSEPAKVYSEPAKVYGKDGRPVEVTPKTKPKEPENPEEEEVGGEERAEENYEVDEAASVESNGSVHGPQTILDTGSDSRDDRNKVFVVEEPNYRKYRVEERTADGFIVGEYGVVSHDDGSLRGVRYTADGSIDPQIIYDILKKFFDP